MYPKMKRLFTYFLLPLLLAGTTAVAQEKSMLDSISLGNVYNLNANVNLNAGSCLFEKSPEADISNALYGQFSGLLVKNSSSTYDSNQSKLKLSLRLHGHSPLVLVDGLPRDVEDISGLEIESVSILKDAAAAALYGVKGGNGVVMITTRRGKDSPLKVSGTYQYGFATMFRAPEFADAYNNRGYLKYQLQDYEGALLDYDKAIEIDPQDKVFYANRADLFEKLAANAPTAKEKKAYSFKAKADKKKAR